MTTGRPTNYSEAINEQAEAYIEGGYTEQGDAIPSIAGLARVLGVSRECLYEWARQYPRFSDTLGRARLEQERVTLNNGLVGVYNATLCKLILANHGYSERTAQEHTSPDGSMNGPTRVEIVAGPTSDDDSSDGPNGEA